VWNLNHKIVKYVVDMQSEHNYINNKWCIKYQLTGHHQIVFNLSSNYIINVVYCGMGGDEISFTIVSDIDSNLIDR